MNPILLALNFKASTKAGIQSRASRIWTYKFNKYVINSFYWLIIVYFFNIY